MNEEIYAFAYQYFNLYRDPKVQERHVDEGFADKCFALGFEMDCGKSFCEKYPKAFHDYEELNKIIEEIDDPKFLGTAIFSQWRYITHWSDGSSLLDDEHRKWFIIAFGRLVSITCSTDPPPYVFYGNIKRVKINSCNVCYGPSPEEDDEIEQHLTITDDGRVWISRYAFGGGLNKHRKIEQKQFKIGAVQAKFLLDKYTEYFKNEYEMPFATDVGRFDMQITDDEGNYAFFIGSLCSQFEVDGFNLSQLTRDIIGDQTLFVFDGANSDKIKRVKIDYYSKKVFPSEDIPTGIIWKTEDHVLIDRKSETIEYEQKIADECGVLRKYHVAEGVSSFLDGFDAGSIFTEIPNANDNIEEIDRNDVADYEITVEFYRHQPRKLSGKYDKLGLPVDWPDFIDDLYMFMSFYGFGGLFDENQYERTYRKKDDYIFLSVQFNDYGKTYYYLTDDDSIEADDKVVVPVGNGNAERIVRVAQKEYFSADAVPMSIDRVKYIIRKFDDADNRQKIDIEEEDYVAAHKFASNHMAELKQDSKCGCFYCNRIFQPSEIEEWLIDDNPCDRNGTAICPYCGVDSVIGESSGYPITEEFLKKMNKYWF